MWRLIKLKENIVNQMMLFSSDLKELRNCYFTHHLCGVIICSIRVYVVKSASSTYSFRKLVFRPFVFSAYSVFLFYVPKLYKIYVIIVFIYVSYSEILFLLSKK